MSKSLQGNSNQTPQSFQKKKKMETLLLLGRVFFSSCFRFRPIEVKFREVSSSVHSLQLGKGSHLTIFLSLYLFFLTNHELFYIYPLS